MFRLAKLPSIVSVLPRLQIVRPQIRAFCLETEYKKEIDDINKDYEERMKRRQAMIGIVVSDKCSKSITVQVIREKFVAKYNKTTRVRRKFMAHDEEEKADLGDVVRIIPCRPMSKKKRHALIDILKKGKVFTAEEQTQTPK